MNARNFLYITRFNKGAAKRRADDKLETKRLLIQHHIPTPKILKAFSTHKSLNSFNWELPSIGFVIKPARGFGGEGILVINKWDGEIATTVSGKKYTKKQLKSHIFDIFEGIYSLQSLPDKAYFEERISPIPFFRKLAPIGLPDVRIIVFNKVPVMAMMRLPTDLSGGKANLHQGAIGVGIGMRTGITNFAVMKDRPLATIPFTKIKTSGIKIPDWDNIVLLAARAQDISGLGYAGVDIVVDKNLGPVVLEINARPGLSIQIANQASLRERLERIEELPVTSVTRGVEISKSIYAEHFSERVKSEPKVLSIIETIKIVEGDNTKEYQAKLDTGAYRTSLDHSVVEELLLKAHAKKFWAISANGRQERPAVNLTFYIGGRKITTVATVAKRTHLRFPIIIGRRDLKGFYINPVVTAQKEEEIIEDSPDDDEEVIE
ncbi:MAG TPA: sugar-transfer associated ATP-grasp domain-containing protein [Patescibacteria group bacterium]|nr:sugar-transfer associated ATP-grasp domain-containing protein [Patescibacteria group bacterium]